jgi:hypothetical protein
MHYINKSIAIVTIFSFLSATLASVYAGDTLVESPASTSTLTRQLDPIKLGREGLPYVQPSLWRSALSTIGLDSTLPTIDLSKIRRNLQSPVVCFGSGGLAVNELLNLAAADLQPKCPAGTPACKSDQRWTWFSLATFVGVGVPLLIYYKWYYEGEHPRSPRRAQRQTILTERQLFALSGLQVQTTALARAGAQGAGAPQPPPQQPLPPTSQVARPRPDFLDSAPVVSGMPGSVDPRASRIEDKDDSDEKTSLLRSRSKDDSNAGDDD